MSYPLRLLVALALLACAAPALAQIPTRPVARTPVRVDTLRADTAGADSAGRPAAPPDSVLQQLLRLPGYTPTEYAGDSAVYRADDQTLRLRGNAEVVRGTERLTADSILYRRGMQRVDAYGNPKVTGGAQEVTGETLFYDLERRRVTIQGGQTQFSQGADWRVVGDLTAPAEGNRFYATDIQLTTDDRPKPQYHFRVGKLYVVRDRILVGRPAWLYFGDVPVFPLPFVFQNLEEGRASGVLVPRFGINDIVRTGGRNSRQISNVGYYWAINDYLGAQLSGEWRSNAYSALLGGADLIWKRQFLNASFTYQQYWRDGGGQEQTVSGSGNWRPDERTTLSGRGSYASSSAFVRRESVDPLEVTRNLTSAFKADRRFDWGTGSFGATREQSIASGRVDATLPDVGISVTPITLFEQPIPELARWYNNLTFALAASGRRATVDLSDSINNRLDALGRRRPDEERIDLRTNQSLRLGNLSLNNNVALNRDVSQALAAGDEFPEAPRIDRDRGTISSSLSYQQTLIGSSSISPAVQYSQELIRNDTTGGEYLLGPRRLSLGAGLNTDLYGFYPGVGPYTAIRHHFKPSFTYAYTPEVAQTPEQAAAFGPNVGRARNVVQVGFTNTFEAKLRDPERDAAADTVAGDSARPAAPAEPRKVTILAINTSAVEYDFIQAREDGNGFRTETISNSVTSDYLNGLNLSFTHSLFEPARSLPLVVRLGPERERGDFAPRLSSVNASFSFGQGSAFFRFLGLGPRDRNNGEDDPGLVPDSGQIVDPAPRRVTSTGNPQGVGGGPWRASIQYSLTRPRETSQLFLPNQSGEAQMLNGTLNFSPTRNWAVNWSTRYSVTDRKFLSHSLNIRRDLYRWQANFDFYRTPTGNTSFEFSAQLVDLPELRIPFRERDIGADDR